MCFQEILGENYSEALAEKLRTAIEKNYVPLEKFKSLEQEKEAEIAQFREREEKTKKTVRVSEELRRLGAIDPDYIIYRQGGIESFSFDEKGRPLSLSELSEEYLREKSTAYLFGGEERGYSPAAGENQMSNPFSRENFNLTEQGRLFKKDPAGARRLAAAAKVKL